MSISRLDLNNLPTKNKRVTPHLGEGEGPNDAHGKLKPTDPKPVAVKPPKMVAESPSEDEDESSVTASSDSKDDDHSSGEEYESESEDGSVHAAEFFPRAMKGCFCSFPGQKRGFRRFRVSRVGGCTCCTSGRLISLLVVSLLAARQPKRTSRPKLKKNDVPQALFYSDSDEEAVVVHINCACLENGLRHTTCRKLCRSYIGRAGNASLTCTYSNASHDSLDTITARK
ncbi:hypothetical protein B0H11DRAFT_227241 [Mycena galericulata]|nr:hypothetical protein B0H11DRAFT_227241 [Mycena galericulata]